MNGFRYPSALFVLALAMSQTGCRSAMYTSDPVVRASSFTNESAPSSAPANNTSYKQRLTCKIYPLREFCDDQKLGDWLVATLPQVISPREWIAADNEARSVNYYAPANILVVYQTAAVHTQVADFLKNLKKSMPPTQVTTESRPRRYFANPEMTDGNSATRANVTRRADPNLAPAVFMTPSTPAKMPEASPINKSTAYPIPAPLSQPKHLFHLVIRYEGDGVLDAAMTDAVKALSGGAPAKESGDDKSKSDDGKSLSSQLLHFILRYEGDGIVDANVVEFMKAIADYATQGQNGGVTYPAGAPMPSYNGPVAPFPPGVPPPPPFGNGPGAPFPYPMTPVQPTTFAPVPSGNGSYAPVLSGTSLPMAPVCPSPVRMMPPADEGPRTTTGHQP